STQSPQPAPPTPPGISQPESTPWPPSTPASLTEPETPSSDPPVDHVSPPSSGSVQDIYNYVLKSTTWILNLQQDRISSGTGSVIDANERLILTNYHVVANMHELVVFFPIYENKKPVVERERYMTIFKESTKSPEDLLRAELIATDPTRDVALIRVPKLPPGTETLPIAKSLVNIGQTVHSVGNPGASGALWVYTPGVVRSVYRHKWKVGGEHLLLTLDAEVVE